MHPQVHACLHKRRGRCAAILQVQGMLHILPASHQQALRPSLQAFSTAWCHAAAWLEPEQKIMNCCWCHVAEIIRLSLSTVSHAWCAQLYSCTGVCMMADVYLCLHMQVRQALDPCPCGRRWWCSRRVSGADSTACQSARKCATSAYRDHFQHSLQSSARRL